MGTTIASSNLVSAFKGLSLSNGSSFLHGDFKPVILGHRSSISYPIKVPLIIEAAHKKGSGSTKNGRDSIGKRLGVKIYGDQAAKAGSIIIRQRGTKFHPGNNVGLGRDYTIFSLIEGVVKFEKYGPDKKKVSVYPRILQVKPEDPNSRRVKRREFFRLQREKRKAREAGIPFPELALASAELQEPTVENAIC